MGKALAVRLATNLVRSRVNVSLMAHIERFFGNVIPKMYRLKLNRNEVVREGKLRLKDLLRTILSCDFQ
jgi:hypothetical protein